MPGRGVTVPRDAMFGGRAVRPDALAQSVQLLPAQMPTPVMHRRYDCRTGQFVQRIAAQIHIRIRLCK